MYLPKLRELREALRSLFSAPYTTKFPKVTYTPASEYRGFPKYFTEFCVGCGTCAQVCPTEAIEIKDSMEEKKRYLTINYAACAQCGQCQEHCITGKGIQNTTHHSIPAWNLKAPELYNSITKELILCEACGSVIACYDHLRFIKERLGAKAYANPVLLLLTQSEFTEVIPTRIKGEYRREDLMKWLCPHCRHKVVVKDEF